MIEQYPRSLNGKDYKMISLYLPDEVCRIFYMENYIYNTKESLNCDFGGKQFHRL